MSFQREQSARSFAQARVTRTCVLVAMLALGACGRVPEVTVFASDAYPERLSDWGLLRRSGDQLVLGRGVEPYEINTPLFSDYALKLRTWYLPPGTSMTYRADEAFEFPVGSVITKTFFYPLSSGTPQAVAGWHADVGALDLDEHHLVETRLLVRQAGGWDALPYVWNGDDAFLNITGSLRPVTLAVEETSAEFTYVVPSRSECASCHATDHGDGALELIGLKARHLNRSYPGAGVNQLAGWSKAGHLSGLPDAGNVTRGIVWDDPDAPVEARARAYLDSNCGHCHSMAGAADTSGLLLDASVTSYRQLGACKPPIAAGRGTGGRQFSIVPGEPDASILVYRMETDDPATRMPELGRAIAHREGVSLIREWVASLPGECI